MRCVPCFVLKSQYLVACFERWGKTECEQQTVSLLQVLSPNADSECCGGDGVQYFCFCANRTMVGLLTHSEHREYHLLVVPD
jgi:hypothetical protein